MTNGGEEEGAAKGLADLKNRNFCLIIEEKTVELQRDIEGLLHRLLKKGKNRFFERKTVLQMKCCEGRKKMDHYKWDLGKMFADTQEIEEAMAELKNALPQVEELKKDMKKNIYELFELREKLARKSEKLLVYASMKKDEDSTVAESQKLVLNLQALVTQLNTAFSFLSPYLLSLEESEVKELKSDERYEFYKTMFERIFRTKEHMLSKEQEFVLSSLLELMSSPENSFYMLSYADMEFPVIENSPDKEKLTHSNYVRMMTDKNRELRKEAFEKMYETYGKYENTFASTLYGSVKANVTTSQLRNFKSAREMALFEDDIDLKVYDTLVECIHENLDTLYRYYEVKKKALGLKEYHLYDVYANTTQDYDRKIPFEEAKQIVLNALEPLGEEYCNIVREAFDERWIDVYPKKGKRSGAYSSGCYDSLPYILMNYNDNLESLFTLVHELGHSVHSYYSRKYNPYIYSSYTIFVAEVASTTNEMLLIHYLLKNSKSKEETEYLLNYSADMFKSTIFRQTMFAEFEKIIHEKVESGEGLTAEELKTMYYGLNRSYFGENVEVDPQIALEWARIPHFYSDFYVYKYATGLSAAVLLSKKILTKEAGALENYLNFLKNGSREFPIGQLRKAGADMTKKESLQEAMAVFKERVEALENL